MDINHALHTIAQTSFKEVLNQLPSNPFSGSEEELDLAISDKSHSSILITVSSSMFRILALLHVPAVTARSNHLLPILNFKSDQANSLEQQYLDYISEMSNNLGGVCARVLRTAGFPTGLSQPALLNRVYTTTELKSLSPNHIVHMQVSQNDEPAIGISFVLFVNPGSDDDIKIDVSEIEECTESSGELEFF